jgi:hypothetical protein
VGSGTDMVAQPADAIVMTASSNAHAGCAKRVLNIFSNSLVVLILLRTD